jgi:glc operon protein GlcG
MTPRQIRTIGQEDAALIADACLTEARNLGVAVCIAVTDNAGHLLHFVRMDDAPLLSASIAQDKAYSVAAFNGLPTDAWWGLIAKDDALVHGIVKTDRLIVFGGGRPCLVDGELVGAVGVSGGSADQDVAVASAGAAALAEHH